MTEDGLCHVEEFVVWDGETWLEAGFVLHGDESVWIGATEDSDDLKLSVRDGDGVATVRLTPGQQSAIAWVIGAGDRP